MMKMILLIFFVFWSNLWAKETIRLSELKGCEVGFVKMLTSQLPREYTGVHFYDLWSKDFNPEEIIKSMKTLTPQERKNWIEQLKALVDKDEVFNVNLTRLMNKGVAEEVFHLNDIKKLFKDVQLKSTKFYVSDAKKTLSFNINIPQEKIVLINKILSSQKLSADLFAEYERRLLTSELTVDELKTAMNSGMKLNDNFKDFRHWADYMDFLEVQKPHRRLKGLKNINEIYDYQFQHQRFIPDFALTPHKDFLSQKSRVAAYENKRLEQIERELKIANKESLDKKLRDIAKREAAGEKVPQELKDAVEKEIKSSELPEHLIRRMSKQAAGEAQIYQKLLNGCSGGKKGKQLEKASKKFARFKTAIGLGTTVYSYMSNNMDKYEEDDYWWHKLFWDVGTSIAFNYASTKIVVNPNTSFLKKYLTGYTLFSGMDAVAATGYGLVFGKDDAELQKQLDEFRKSPTFDKDIAELYAYLEEKEKINNTKNLLDNMFDLNIVASNDSDKITQEDLETEEGREMMLELLAERMYLENMGNVEFFQTGSKGLDRWLYLRTYHLPMSAKSLVLNMAIFNIMCVEPFGRVGSYAVALGIVFTDSLIFNDLGYKLRREAINQ